MRVNSLEEEELEERHSKIKNMDLRFVSRKYQK